MDVFGGDDAPGVAESLSELIRGEADEIERRRGLTEEVVTALRSAGLFHMLLPRSLDGPEVEPAEACRAIEELSAADGSTGWCVMLSTNALLFAGMLPRARALEVFGERQILAGSSRPVGKAVPCGDDYEISGRWPFASGSTYADWFSAHCILFDRGERRRNADGKEVRRVLLVPANRVVIHDVWHTTGLRGTGSHDFSIEDVRVPGTRSFELDVDPPVDPWPFYRATPLIFVTHGSQALGVARAAIRAAVKTANSRPARGMDGGLLNDQPRFQAAVAEATVIRESARTYLYETCAGLWASAVEGAPDNVILRSRVRLAASHAVRASTEAVDLLHLAVGTSSIFDGSPLERQFRDIHTAAAHVQVAPETYEAAGRAELGLEPGFPFF